LGDHLARFTTGLELTSIIGAAAALWYLGRYREIQGLSDVRRRAAQNSM
jgi:hypothetical protein